MKEVGKYRVILYKDNRFFKKSRNMSEDNTGRWVIKEKEEKELKLKKTE